MHANVDIHRLPTRFLAPNMPKNLRLYNPPSRFVAASRFLIVGKIWRVLESTIHYNPSTFLAAATFSTTAKYGDCRKCETVLRLNLEAIKNLEAAKNVLHIQFRDDHTCPL